MSYVYFIQVGTSGPIKIGRAQDVEQRLRKLQTGSAWPLRLRRAIKTNKAAGLERMLHAIFIRYRLEGEWFAPGEEVEEFIESGRNWPESSLVRIARAWGDDPSQPPSNVVSLAAVRMQRRLG